jgi:hypothetical protein
MKEQERVFFFKMEQIRCKITSRYHFGRTSLVKQNGLEEPVSRQWVNHSILLFICNDASVRIGTHYWYDNYLNTNCSEFLPGFIMYNKGQLSAFGWSIVSKLDFSRRVEFPPKAAIFVCIFFFLSQSNNYLFSRF